MLGELDIMNWIKINKLRRPGDVAKLSGEDPAKRVSDEELDHGRTRLEWADVRHILNVRDWRIAALDTAIRQGLLEKAGNLVVF